MWTVSVAREERRVSRNKTHGTRSSDAYDGRLYSSLTTLPIRSEQNRKYTEEYNRSYSSLNNIFGMK